MNINNRDRFEDEDRAMSSFAAEEREMFLREEREAREWAPSDEEAERHAAEAERHAAEVEAAYAAYAAHEARLVAHVTDVSTGAALDLVTDLHGGDDYDGECPAPVEVLEVLDTNGHSYIKARVRCADGTVRVAVAAAHYYPGDRECPPDYNVEFTYELDRA